MGKSCALGDPGCEPGEAAGDQGRHGAGACHRRDQGAGAIIEPDALVHHLVEDRLRLALQKADAFLQGALELDLAAHGAFGDGRDLGLDACEIRQFVDAFAIDDGGIHVGDQQALAAVGDCDDIRVDWRVDEATADVRQDFRILRAELAGRAGGQPVRGHACRVGCGRDAGVVQLALRGGEYQHVGHG